MNREQLLDAIYAHPDHTIEKLDEYAQGQSLTNKRLLGYLFYLENWVPLKVQESNSLGWYLVASQSEPKQWHRTYPEAMLCSCQHGLRENIKLCSHLSAVQEYIEDRWIKKAEANGFKVFYVDGVYCIRQGKNAIGIVNFDDNKREWKLTRENDKIDYFSGIGEVIEFLVASASFGWQYQA